MADLDLSGVGACYIRVSDNDTKQTTDRQHSTIKQFLDSHKATIPPQNWFEDVDEKRHQFFSRTNFSRLMKLVDAKAFQWIVVNALDRGLGKDENDYLRLYLRLQDAGCHLYDVAGNDYAARGLDSLLKGIVGAKVSNEELNTKGKRSLEGRNERAKRGQYTGGRVPYCMDVVCFRSDGTERWRCVWEGRHQRVKVLPDGSREA